MSYHTAVPIQLIKETTLQGKGEIQEIATRAWNFCTAQYYKAEGVPWCPLTLEQNTCYVGVNFYVAQELDGKLSVRSSLAQAFDYLGQGLILRGDQFNWDTERLGRSPHLTKTSASKLIKGVLQEYINVRGNPPRRVVIHKTSEFWGADRGEFNELDGFYEGIGDVFSQCETDFVTLRPSRSFLLREGIYPPLRGTYFCVEDSYHFLYTMGFIPYLETSPSPYIPTPWEITRHIGGSSPIDMFREVLGLTKMNFNSCAFADGTPITLSFSHKVGDIMKHIPSDGAIQPSYRFYM